MKEGHEQGFIKAHAEGLAEGLTEGKKNTSDCYSTYKKYVKREY